LIADDTTLLIIADCHFAAFDFQMPHELRRRFSPPAVYAADFTLKHYAIADTPGLIFA